MWIDLCSWSQYQGQSRPSPYDKASKRAVEEGCKEKDKKEQSLTKDKDKDNNTDLETSMEEATTSMDEHEKSAGSKVEHNSSNNSFVCA